MYKCINSSKCISRYRLLDDINDCDYGDDEKRIATNDPCSTGRSEMYFYCAETNKCISRKLVGDDQCHCYSEFYGMCDEEFLFIKKIREHISFPSVCDVFTDLKPLTINGRNETDETECEQWSCNNIYTRCNGFWNCFDGADEVDCHPRSLLSCPSHSHVCISPKTMTLICLAIDKGNNGEIDCLGATDELQLCKTEIYSTRETGFYCKDRYDERCLSRYQICDKEVQCIENEDDEAFCNSSQNFDFLRFPYTCDEKHPSNYSDMEQFLCNAFKFTSEPKAVYFSLNSVARASKPVTTHDTNTEFLRSPNSEMSFEQSTRCHRGLNLRVWLDSDKDMSNITCLCPPSYYGDTCQYQNQRVSLTVQVQALSASWRIPFNIIVSLIDNSDERLIHSYEQFTYLPMKKCQRKFNIYLLYSTRPKNQTKHYWIHIDIHEKISLSYRGSSLIPVPFPFLPVQRITTLLNIPHTQDNVKKCFDHQCINGHCIRYFDHPNNTTFCQCNKGWSGRYCTISHTCMCSSDSLCLGVSVNNRSLCVCSIKKWGSRCLLHNQVCQSNTTCHNGGQCIPIDQYVVSDRKFECICPMGFFGELCERTQHTITLSFEKTINLPQSMFVHFVETKDNALHENGLTFKKIPANRNPVIVSWSRPFHIAFVEFFPNDYYLIVAQKTYNQSAPIIKILKSSDRCINIRDVFNESLVQLHLIRRIKYYHLPCQRNSSQLSCFYDDVHICLCNDFNDQRHANCFEFNHTKKHDCSGQSNCENGAKCLQDSASCPETFMCVCPSCFFGTQCQFSSNGYSLSLDAILGYHIQPHVSIVDQPFIVIISIILTILITLTGLIDSVLTMITFKNKELCKIGCGIYLLGSSITTVVTMTLFSLKFWILIIAQMTYMTNRSFLHVQCSSIDFLLKIGLSMDQWLNACVSIERAITILKGINFDQKKSRKIAVYIITILLVLTISTHIQEPIYRRLIDEVNNDEKRIWCIVTYSSNIQVFNLVMHIFHFASPFIINIISAILIIRTTTRLKTSLQTNLTYRQVLRKQFQKHKHVLVAPFLLVILAIPRLIIAIVSGCIKSTSDSWLFLIGYFISFVPPMLTFVIFVLPSNKYKQEFVNTVKRYQKTITTRLPFVS